MRSTALIATAMLLVTLGNALPVAQGSWGQDGKDGQDGLPGQPGQHGQPGLGGAGGAGKYLPLFMLARRMNFH